MSGRRGSARGRTRAALGILALALLAATIVATAPGAAARSAAGGRPDDPATDASARLPACRIADVLTRWNRLDQFRVTILDTRFRLRYGYRPPLRSVSAAGFGGGFSVRRDVIPDLRAMRRAMIVARVPVAIRSAYRSYSRQASVFAGWVRAGGYAMAIRTSARPGHSEHQLGTAVDFMTPGMAPPWAYRDWGTSRTGSWLARNSWKYGFVLSYPKGKYSTSCYNYESWHFRWVGRTVAARIHASRLVPRVWLWRNGAAWANPTPRPKPTPRPTASPTPPPSQTPVPSPSVAPTPSPTPEVSVPPSPVASQPPGAAIPPPGDPADEPLPSGVLIGE